MNAYPLPTINCLTFVAYSGARIALKCFYVTGQPSEAAYPGIVSAGVKSVVCVRQPGEVSSPPPVPPPPAFNPNAESAAFAKLGIAWTNVPITRQMTQAQFDAAATQAATALLRNASLGPAMVHCSTGDRASSVFAAMLIALGMPNADAAQFGINQLLLANSSIVSLVEGYTPSAAAVAEMREAAAASSVAIPGFA
jgi:protein tyrosine phosphatase (PTP) superfamily phosphohydrolase (DUF442 family)